MMKPMAFFCFIYVAMLQTMLVFLEIYTSLELGKNRVAFDIIKDKFINNF